MAAYHQIIVETYYSSPRGDKGDIRVRPAKGQFYSPTLAVECSRSLRTQYPVGTKFLMQVKLCNKEGTEFLYSHHSWPVTVVSSR